MIRHEQPRRRRPGLRVYLLAAFALAIWLGVADSTMAQSQWATNGNDINNTNTGNVGIGTTSPGSKLHVYGSGTYNDGLRLQYSGSGTPWNIVQGQNSKLFVGYGTTTAMVADVTGNIGIGTTTPPYLLTIEKDYNGPANISILNTADGPAAQASLGVSRTTNYSDKYFALGVTAPSFANPGFGETAYLHSRGVPIKLGTQTAHDIHFFTNGIANTTLTIASGGNVGIGTTSPGAKLDVVGGAYNTGIKITSSSVSGSGLTIKSTDTGGHEFNILATATNITGGAGGLHIYDATVGAGRLRIGPNGDVGIGTLAPLYKLDVNGEINATGLRINGTPISTGGPGGPVTWAQVDKTASSLADITTRSAGDLSSGTLPDARFPATLPAVSGANLTALNASNLASGTVATARLGSGTANSTTFLRGDNTWAVPGGSQWTTSGSSVYYNTGNVGIGTTNPGAKLEVSGNVNVTGTGNISAAGTIAGGNIVAKYQDVAEWVPSRQKLAAGTVVVLDIEQSNQVTASTHAYDTKVAGVVSSQPGVILGEAGENKAMVATTGRVKVKVDASSAPIKVGDLLVTGEKEGVAMKSEPVNISGVQLHRPGTLIGKALEPLAKGTGEILVLLSLQ